MNIVANTMASYPYVWERSSLIKSYRFYLQSQKKFLSKTFLTLLDS